MVLFLPNIFYKLLMSLCAHDFRHDFMSSSTRVHTGYILGLERRGGGSTYGQSHKLSDETVLAEHLNDITFLDALQYNKVNTLKGKSKENALRQAKLDAFYKFSLIIRVINILNKCFRKKSYSSLTRKESVFVSDSSKALGVGAIKRGVSVKRRLHVRKRPHVKTRNVKVKNVIRVDEGLWVV